MIKKIFAGLCLLGMSSGAFATTQGVLDINDGVWDGCGASSGVGCAFESIQFTVDADGAYTLTTLYAGDTTLDENLDGYIYVYENSFDSTDNGVSAIASDDDYSGDFGCVGPNCSQVMVGLTAGTSYFLVITSFDDAPSSFGQNEGPWEIVGADGPGNVTFKAPVPVPGALLLMASGLLGLGAARRKS